MAKLVNNILTVANLRNAVEAFAVARSAGVDLDAMQDALASSSGGSFIIQAIGRQIVPEIAGHIAELNRKDVLEFSDAMRERELDPRAIVDWAMAGPDGLPELVKMMSDQVA